MSTPVDDDADATPVENPVWRDVERAVLGLLLIVMIGQTIYLLTYSRDLRLTQEALVCQQRVTQQLRDAAILERDAQRTLLTTLLNPDPKASREQQQQRGREVVNGWLKAIDISDSNRRAVPQCPPLE